MLDFQEAWAEEGRMKDVKKILDKMGTYLEENFHLYSFQSGSSWRVNSRGKRPRYETQPRSTIKGLKDFNCCRLWEFWRTGETLLWGKTKGKKEKERWQSNDSREHFRVTPFAVFSLPLQVKIKDSKISGKSCRIFLSGLRVRTRRTTVLWKGKMKDQRKTSTWNKGNSLKFPRDRRFDGTRREG